MIKKYNTISGSFYAIAQCHDNNVSHAVIILCTGNRTACYNEMVLMILIALVRVGGAA